MSLLTGLFNRRHHFEGGLFLPEHKSRTARRPIETVLPAGTLHIPLTIRRDLKTRTVVSVGQHVARGQALSVSACENSVPVHAPASGTIVRFSRVWSPFDGFLPGVVLAPDGRTDAIPQRQGWEDESIVVQLAQCGAICHQPRAPLHVVLKQAIAARVTDLVVNGMETEPYLTADLRTLVEEPGRLIDALCDLADAVGVDRAIIAAPDRHRRTLKRLASDARGRYVEVVALPNRYPQCHPIILTRAVLEREVPPGGTPLDVGALVLPLASVRGAAEALLDDRPLTHTVMSVAGDVVDRAGTYRVPVGMPLRDVAVHAGLLAPAARAICGGPLTGVPLGHPDAVVTPDTTALLLFSTSPESEAVSCVRCGWCIEDCPVGVDPTWLIQLESASGVSDLDRAHLRACIDCGLCTHICPSQLPLAETISRTRLRHATGGGAGQEAPTA